MYEFSVYALIIIGLVAGGVFVLTWTPYYLKARRRPELRARMLGPMATFDFAGWTFAAFLLFCLSAYNVLTIGIVYYPETSQRVSMIGRALLITSIVVLRAFLWIRKLMRTPAHERDQASIEDARMDEAPRI